jgi:hypothetical protein
MRLKYTGFRNLLKYNKTVVLSILRTTDNSVVFIDDFPIKTTSIQDLVNIYKVKYHIRKFMPNYYA